MSDLGTDRVGMIVQAFRLPLTGKTTKITAGAGAGSASGALTAGWYRIVSDTAVTICEGASAVATDMPVRANVEEYFYVHKDQKIAVWNATGAPANVYATLMP